MVRFLENTASQDRRDEIDEFLYLKKNVKTLYNNFKEYYMYTRLRTDKDGKVGKGIKFERIRRITGYLIGTLDRFNNGKKAEEHDRVKHMHV